MFVMEIHTDNRAFDDNSEYFELKGIFDRAMIQLSDGREHGMCYDSNGNYVGFWKIDNSTIGRYDSPVKYKE